MKKKDIILLSVIISLVAVVGVVYLILSHKTAEDISEKGYITVEVDGEEVARYNLSQEGEYLLNGGTNTLRIENGEAYLVDATCPDHSCVKSGKVTPMNPIVCLPNKLIITVHDVEGEVDLVVN